MHLALQLMKSQNNVEAPMTDEEELISKAKKTTYPSPYKNTNQFNSNEEKIEYIASKFRDIMVALGLDLDDDSLQRSPYRVAKMYVNEVFSGLNEDNFPEIRFVKNEFNHTKFGNMIFVKTNLSSTCEHHFVPVIGTAYVAYLPQKKIIGLSKISRIVNFFSKRPQLQERLGEQIADCLSILLESPHVAISITAQHFCMIARGIEDHTSHTTTNVLRGNFDSDSELRREFFEAINRSTSKY